MCVELTYSGAFAEEQAVAGRWCALTISQMRRTGNNDVEELFVQMIVYHLLNILVTAGWAGSIEQVRTAIVTKFQDRLMVVAKQAIRLRKTIGEDIISSDYEVLYVNQGDEFNSAIMDDAYAEEPSNSQLGRRISVGVLCSELGLRRITKENRENGRTESLVLKPKIGCNKKYFIYVNKWYGCGHTWVHTRNRSVEIMTDYL
jgi:hypothetical protein